MLLKHKLLFFKFNKSTILIAALVSLFMVNIGPNKSVLARINNDQEYIWSMLFAFSLTLIVLFSFKFYLSRSLKSNNINIRNFLIFTFIVTNIIVIAVYFYNVFMFNYIEGTNFFDVQLPLSVLVCFLIAAGNYYVLLFKSKQSNSFFWLDNNKLSKELTRIKCKKNRSIQYFLPVEIALIHHANGINIVYLKNGEKAFLESSFNNVYNLLKPFNFYRLNRQIIACKDCIKKFSVTNTRRLKITTSPEIEDEIFVSKNNAASFKAWIEN